MRVRPHRSEERLLPRGAEEWKLGFKQKAYQADGLHMLRIRFMQPSELFQTSLTNIKEENPAILQYYILT